MLRIITVMPFSYMFVSSHANRDQIFSVAGLVPLLDQNLPKHQPNLTSAYRAKTHFCKLTEPFSTFQVFNPNL